MLFNRSIKNLNSLNTFLVGEVELIFKYTENTLSEEFKILSSNIRFKYKF